MLLGSSKQLPFIFVLFLSSWSGGESANHTHSAQWNESSHSHFQRSWICLIYSMEGGRQVRGAVVFFYPQSHSSWRNRLPWQVKHRKGKRKKKKTLLALPFPCSVQTVQQRGKKRQCQQSHRWIEMTMKTKIRYSCREGEKSSAGACLTGRQHINTEELHIERGWGFCLLLMEKKRLRGAIKIS